MIAQQLLYPISDSMQLAFQYREAEGSIAESLTIRGEHNVKLAEGFEMPVAPKVLAFFLSPPNRIGWVLIKVVGDLLVLAAFKADRKSPTEGDIYITLIDGALARSLGRSFELKCTTYDKALENFEQCKLGSYSSKYRCKWSKVSDSDLLDEGLKQVC